MDILSRAVKLTNEYVDQMPKELRKKYGQFFTSQETALFMAGLFHVPENQETITALDPGAGSGILSMALIKKLEYFGKIKRINLTCYENDPHILPVLQENLEWASEHSTIKIEYKIIADNYILAQKEEYAGIVEEKKHEFDIVIANPPYMKISKNTSEALSMPDVCYGAPNLYFLFAAMSLFNLKENGEMVYIMPRSWTSGAYFRKFREKLLSVGVLEHIHLFISRDKVFEGDSILQETIILKVRKSTKKPSAITVTTTKTNADFSKMTTFKAPYSTVVSGEAFYVYLVTNMEEVQTLESLNQWKQNLPVLGMKMKTGLTVDFRNRDMLRNEPGEKTVPLFYAQHIQEGKVVFPIGKENEYITTGKSGLLQRNLNYLFVKRFTAKEEARRLQCGVYLSRKNPEYTEISTQNKLNFICGTEALSECVVYGLYVLFNSTLYDCYYRILNGSTQVNSTEINSMPVPPMEVIEKMGKELISRKDMSEETCDMILRCYI